MTCTLTQLSEPTMRALLEDPAQVFRLVSPGLASVARGFSPYARDPIELAEGDGRQLDLGKSWNGIHFLLTGMVEGGPLPLAFICSTELMAVGQVDVGYGPARLLPPAQVDELQAALTSVKGSELASNFDPGKMDALEVYPGVWGREDGLDRLDEVKHSFDELKAFVEEASRAGGGIIVAIQ
ncbi:MAG: YfbM family protein [Myxococcota bacterium]